MPDHLFTMELSQASNECSIQLDGQDLSPLLKGVAVTSSVDGGLRIELTPSFGCRVRLRALLPESQIVLLED